MKISELTINSRNVNITGVITYVEEPREITTKYGRTRVANAKIEDETGSISLVLWGDETENVKEGDRIKIENGFIKEWDGVMQLSVGKFGKLTVLE